MIQREDKERIQIGYAEMWCREEREREKERERERGREEKEDIHTQHREKMRFPLGYEFYRFNQLECICGEIDSNHQLRMSDQIGDPANLGIRRKIMNLTQKEIAPRLWLMEERGNLTQKESSAGEGWW